jgi:hypothetical protein
MLTAIKLQGFQKSSSRHLPYFNLQKNKSGWHETDNSIYDTLTAKYLPSIYEKLTVQS